MVLRSGTLREGELLQLLLLVNGLSPVTESVHTQESTHRIWLFIWPLHALISLITHAGDVIQHSQLINNQPLKLRATEKFINR